MPVTSAFVMRMGVADARSCPGTVQTLVPLLLPEPKLKRLVFAYRYRGEGPTSGSPRPGLRTHPRRTECPCRSRSPRPLRGAACLPSKRPCRRTPPPGARDEVYSRDIGSACIDDSRALALEIADDDHVLVPLVQHSRRNSQCKRYTATKEGPRYGSTPLLVGLTLGDVLPSGRDAGDHTRGTRRFGLTNW